VNIIEVQEEREGTLKLEQFKQNLMKWFFKMWAGGMFQVVKVLPSKSKSPVQAPLPLPPPPPHTHTHTHTHTQVCAGWNECLDIVQYLQYVTISGPKDKGGGGRKKTCM
jgi:hypothetical protein